MASSRRKMAVSESLIEYQTLVRYMDKLTIAFKSSPIAVASELFAKGLISQEVSEKALILGISDAVKATEMMMCVADQVRICPGKYYDFMSMKVFEEPWIKSLHDNLIAEYGKLLVAFCMLLRHTNLFCFTSTEASKSDSVGRPIICKRKAFRGHESHY